MSEKYRPSRNSSSRDMPPKKKGKRSRDAALQDVDGRSMEKALPSHDATHVGGVGTSPAKRARNDLESRGTTSPRNGVIKEIVVENFMNHQLLRVNLNPRVNFISGRNGTGKSAIVAALQTCLGATARETGRSDSLQKLVRRHQTKPAYAIVTLHNPKGDLAYRHEVYGDTITIERKIMPSSSSYSLYTHDEWEKHRKNNEYKAKKFTPATGTVKLELASMLDWFSINVTNPCNVLDQQTAQTFITGSDEQKYKFFEDATELKVLGENIKELKLLIGQAENHLKDAGDELADAENRKNRAEREYKNAERMLQLNDDLSEARAILCWFGVQDEEERYKRRVARAETCQDDVDQSVALLKVATENLATERARVDEESKSNDGLKAAYEQLDGAKVEKIKAIKELKRPLQQKNREMKHIGDGIKETEKSILKDRAKIENLQRAIIDLQRASGSQQNVNQEATLRREIHECQERYRELDEELQRVDAQGRSVRNECDGATERLTYLQSEAERAKRGWEDAKRTLQQVHRAGSGGDPMAIYGSDLARLRTAVNQQRARFKGPRLPFVVGGTVSLVPGCQKYAKGAEFVTGRVLPAVLVSCKADKSAIYAMAKELRIRPPKVSFFSHKSTEKKQFRPLTLPQTARTVEQCLKVDDPFGYNFLAFSTNTHKVVLIDNDDGKELNRFLDSGEGRQVLQAISLQVDRKGSIKSGQRYTQPIHNFRAKNFLQESIAGQVANLKRDEEETSATFQAKNAEAQRARVECERLKKEVQAMDRRRSQLLREQAQMRESMKAKQNKLRKLEEQSVDQRDEADEKVNQKKMEIETCNSNITFLEANNDNEKAKLPILQREARDLEERIAPLEADLKSLMAQREKAQDDLNRAREKLNDMEDGVDELSLKKSRAKQFVSKMTERADKAEEARLGQQKTLEMTRQQCIALHGPERPNIPADATMDRLEEDIKLKEDGLKKAKEKYEDPEIIKSRYLMRTNQYKQKKQNIAFVVDQMARMKAFEAKKRERHEGLRASVCKNSSHMFNQVLALQQQHGHVTFDHTKKELMMNVELGEKRALVKDVKSLSGGERSTATLSLLMALLKSVNSPFTVLDEFDVAMDEGRRSQSINSVVKMAELQESRQFIFITPHSLSAVQRTDTVNGKEIERDWISVYRMPDKEVTGPGGDD